MNTQIQEIISDIKTNNKTLDGEIFANEDVHNIISCFGGLLPMIELCIANPQIKAVMNEAKLIQLSLILNKYKTHDKIKHNSNNSYTRQNEANTATTSILSDKSNAFQHIGIDSDHDDLSPSRDDINSNDIINNNSNTIMSPKSDPLKVVTPSLDDYFKSKVIIECDTMNNFYFKYLSHEQASFIFYEMLLNKIFILSYILTVLMFYIIYYLLSISLTSRNNVYEMISEICMYCDFTRLCTVQCRYLKKKATSCVCVCVCVWLFN